MVWNLTHYLTIQILLVSSSSIKGRIRQYGFLQGAKFFVILVFLLLLKRPQQEQYKNLKLKTSWNVQKKNMMKKLSPKNIL